jgi:glycerate 2-kinase
MIEAPLREDAIAIFRAGVDAVEPRRAVLAHVALEGDVVVADGHRIPLRPGGGVLVVGAGKAAVPMAAAAEEVLGERISGGLVVTKTGHGGPLRRVRVAEASHPVPDAAGVAAADEIMRLLRSATPDDLVVCLVSGGGSALLPSPVEDVTLAEKQAITSALLASGASIAEVNAVRKHLSRVKGGGLARLAHPARVLALILSDVVGDPLDVVASGPTVADPTTYADALAVLDRYGLRDRAPMAVLSHLMRGRAGMIPETPKPGDPELSGVVDVLVGTNAIAVQAAAARARALGYATVILSSTLTGETREIASVHAAIAREIAATGNPVPRPACVISGGETTVTLRGAGKGGRNQEFALAAALEIAGVPGVIVLSAGTDGTDGPTDAAGALVDGTTVARAHARGHDARRHLERNDAYPLFDLLGDLLRTGPTQTNVMDLHVVLAGRA